MERLGQRRWSGFGSRAASRAWTGLLLAFATACVGASQQLPLSPREPASFATGTLEVERIEGGQRLLVIELDDLIPPERVATGHSEYVVWLDSDRGQSVRVGTLHYDRSQRSGNLMATTALSQFTVRVTAEAEGPDAPQPVIVAQRRYAAN